MIQSSSVQHQKGPKFFSSEEVSTEIERIEEATLDAISIDVEIIAEYVCKDTPKKLSWLIESLEASLIQQMEDAGELEAAKKVTKGDKEQEALRRKLKGVKKEAQKIRAYTHNQLFFKLNDFNGGKVRCVPCFTFV